MTRKFFLIAGVAGVALASPAHGQRDDRDRGERVQASQQNERKAQRPQRAERQQVQRAERPQRTERQRVERPRMERQNIQRAERPRIERQGIQRAERPQRIERQRIQRAELPQRIERPRIERQRVERVERPRIERQRVERQRVERAESPRIERQRIQRAERPRIERQRIQRAERPRTERQRVERAERPRIERAERQAVERAERGNFLERRALRGERRELRQRIAEASPRFAPRSDRTWRPMRLRDDRRTVDIGDRIDPDRFTSFVPTFYRTRYFDTPNYFYRYDDDLGYLYRIDRGDNLVRALIPLFGGYGYGDPWPSMYYSSFVPMGYRNYYYDTPDYYYRNDGYGIYQIDAQTQLITALVALVTGQSFGVGQMLPASYGAYNVPWDYRATYYDTDDNWYRYGDGFIYEVDPYTRRIEDRYPIYASGYDYMVGQPWPVAYPGYNVPYGYQSLYYDTPQYHYRYANGAIYQVDPTNQMIVALVALLSGQQLGVGQPWPSTYSAYNVPYAYRDRYFDDEDDWYRYADGVIYQIDPRSGLIEDAIPVYA